MGGGGRSAHQSAAPAAETQQQNEQRDEHTEFGEGEQLDGHDSASASQRGGLSPTNRHSAKSVLEALLRRIRSMMGR